MKVEPTYMHERYAEMRGAEPEPVAPAKESTAPSGGEE